ncbi:hypothetical protein M378DRAFT_165299 [Amanita muscaria Koide BX008]|uniref:Uncharacterized protein n=1 Tax=Amanita muscaria (strain Koide BX008) TaxID=946122 RepID=A0A0C2X298_AMAMK|nr:hypothetical protein M378DRAFT_165299 [Amanita muscaria Koide BX008]
MTKDVKNKRVRVISMKKKKVHWRHLSFGVDNHALYSIANASYMLTGNGPQLGRA